MLTIATQISAGKQRDGFLYVNNRFYMRYIRELFYELFVYGQMNYSNRNLLIYACIFHLYGLKDKLHKRLLPEYIFIY